MSAPEAASPLDAMAAGYRWATRHERSLPAEPAVAMAAARRVTFGDVPLARGLLAVRTLPARLSRLPAGAARGGATPCLELLAARGYTTVLDRPDAIVLHNVGSPWRPTAGARRPATTGPEAAEDAAGQGHGPAEDAVSTYLAFWARPEGPGCRLVTETRVDALTPRAGRAFAAYWRLIEPFSRLIRLEILAAAARRLGHPIDTGE